MNTSNNISNDQLNSSKFFEQIIIPAYLGMTNQNIVFTIHDTSENLILTSNKYAKHLGFESFKDSIFKRPGIDYKRLYDDNDDLFNIQMNFLHKEKQPFDYIYKEKSNSAQVFMATCEPIFNWEGNIIGKREITRPIHLLSHRHIIENHFKRQGTNLAALQNINVSLPHLAETEEIILFMLISGYSQQEIGECLKYSRSYIVKIIAEKLCPKFKVSYLSTKLLVDKAISMGFDMLIPDKFINIINAQINTIK